MGCLAEKAYPGHLDPKANQLKRASRVIVELMETLVPLEFQVREALQGSLGSVVPVKLEKRAALADQAFLERLAHLAAKVNLDRV